MSDLPFIREHLARIDKAIEEGHKFTAEQLIGGTICGHSIGVAAGTAGRARRGAPNFQ